MKNTIRSCAQKIRFELGKLLRLYSPSRVIYNVNGSPLRNQKRVALVYMPDIHISTINLGKVRHPNILQHLIILEVLTELDYIIDIYPCLGEFPYNLTEEHNLYDMIFGFGEIYLKLCENNPKAKKVLFITENAPWAAERKYAERVAYFRERHKTIIDDTPRMGLYTKDMYAISDTAIAMTGSYNADGMKEFLKNIKLIPVNAIPGIRYAIGDKDMSEVHANFVWFGSNGLIHKGLDILIDAFAKLPCCHLSIYGICEGEIRQIKLPRNVHYCGYVNVKSQLFIDEVVSKHAFVLSLSCSEGMMSGIATCMMYGLIPICTNETGYDDCPYVLTFDDWHVERVVNKIKKCRDMDVNKMKEMELNISKYAHKKYTSLYFKDKLSIYLKELSS